MYCNIPPPLVCSNKTKFNRKKRIVDDGGLIPIVLISYTPSLVFRGHGIQGSLVKPYVVNQGI